MTKEDSQLTAAIENEVVSDQLCMIGDAMENMDNEILRASNDVLAKKVRDLEATLDKVREIVNRLATFNVFETRAIVEECSRGYQNCHACPCLGCGDNLLMSDFRKILGRKGN